MKQSHEEKPERSLEEWDAEIEAEYQRVTAAARTKKKSKTWRRLGTFVPRAWELSLLKSTRVATERLARELLYLHWRNGRNRFGRKDEPIAVTNEVAKAVGITPRSKSRALSELQRLGLIRLIRTSGKAPHALLLRVPAPDHTWDRTVP